MKRLSLLVSCLALAGVVGAAPGQKKHKQEEEPVTQALQLPPELPQVTVADADHLVFQVTPLRGQGLLSQQLREELRSLLRQDRPLVKLRAFVAGTGDTRRVQTVVSEMCTDKRVQLPALTVVQVGQLPREGAQVVLESVATERKAVDPNGIVLVPAESDFVSQPLQPVMPHLKRVLDRLSKAAAHSGAGPDDVLRVTCFPSSLDEVDQFRGAAASVFPKAVINFVQPLRAALESGTSCEAAGRLVTAQAGPMRLAFTSAQLAFGTTPADAKLAFERLGKTLAQARTSYDRVVYVSIYALSRSTGEMAARVGREFFDGAKPPAITMVQVEALPSLDATFAVDVVATVPDSK